MGEGPYAEPVRANAAPQRGLFVFRASDVVVACRWQHVHMTTTTFSWDVVPVDKPDDVNVVIGQAHFIKTVEDLHEAMVGELVATVRAGLLRGLRGTVGSPHRQ